MSKNHGFIFLPLAPKIYNNVDKKKNDWNYKDWIIIFVDFIDV